MISFIKTNSIIHIFVDFELFSIPINHINFERIMEELRKGKNAKDQTLKNLCIRTPTFVDKYGSITVSENKIYYKGKLVNNSLSQRIIDMASEGYDIEPWVLFMDNVMRNPSKEAQEELHLFLESGAMPITPDGHFLAFKKVNAEMKSYYDGQTLHVLHQPLEMPRSKVDPDRHNTCSRGFHFCSQKYLNSFGDNRGKTLVLKINPADVVAIPSDYSNQKGRAWRYTPIAILENKEEASSKLFKKPLLGSVKNVDTFKDNIEVKKKDKRRFNNLSTRDFLRAVKRAGGARPYAKENSLAKSTVQDWVTKAKQ